MSTSASVGARPKAVSAASSSARPKAESGTSSSSSRRPRVITIEDDPSEPAAASSSSAVDPCRFSGPQWHKAFPFPGLPDFRQLLNLLVFIRGILLQRSCIRVLWSADQTSLIQVKQDIPKFAGSAIVLDWHQVLGTDRISSRNAQWVDTDGQIPHRHKATLTELSHLCQ